MNWYSVEAQRERRRQEAADFMARLQSDHARDTDWAAFTLWLEAAPLNSEALDALGSVERAIAYRPERSRQPSAFRTSARRSGAGRTWGWLFPTGAGAAVCAGVVGLAVIGMVRAPPVRPTMQATATILVATDRSRAVTLTDGSRVWLNRNSRLSVQLDAQSRHVVLAPGSEAAFDVAHDARRPFVVWAGDRQIRVLGTAFDVDRQADTLVVSVSRGVVRVDAADGAQDGRLTAGQQLVHRQGPARSNVHRIAATEAAGWRTGRLSFEGTSLAEVVPELERYFDRPLVLGASVAGLRFTGVLVIDNQTAILRRLEAYLPVTAHVEADRILLSTRGHP